jgi:methionine-rich copper-binding protein CopC
MRTTLTLLLTALFGAVAALTAVAVPAQAHAVLVSSDPRDGAELMAPPAMVTLTFNEDLLPDFVAFSVTDSSNEPVSVSGLQVDGPTATFTWPESAPAGVYTVSFRVVSQDGHPVEGAIAFSYVTPAPTSATPTPTPSPTDTTPTPTPSPTGSPTSTTPVPSPTESPTVTPSPSPTITPVDPMSATSSIGWIIAIAVIGAGAIVGVVIAVARRR